MTLHTCHSCFNKAALYISRDKMESYLSKKYKFIIIFMNYNKYLQLSYSSSSFFMKTNLGRFKIKEKCLGQTKVIFYVFPSK